MTDEPRRWYDYKGGIFEVPADTPLTTFGKLDRLTHALWTDGHGALVQALTGCGRRGCPPSLHEVPGRGPVDCPECLDPEGDAA